MVLARLSFVGGRESEEENEHGETDVGKVNRWGKQGIGNASMCRMKI